MEKVKLRKSHNFTCNGTCSKCGACCSNILPLTKKEVSNLKRIIKKRNLKPHIHAVLNASYDMTCPFLNDKHECRIYNDRPYICRLYKCDKEEVTWQETKQLLDAEVVNLREEVFK